MKQKIILAVAVTGFILTYGNCSSAPSASGPKALGTTGCIEQLDENLEWSGEVEVPIDGYSANAMEPRISADQVVLFFNDKPASDNLMNIHYAVRQPNGRYQYIGTLPGTVDISSLDGVPAIDSLGNFYFTSLRSYSTNFQTIYSGQIAVLGPNSLAVTGVMAADSLVSRKTPGAVDMDMDVSWDGTMAVMSRAKFSGNSFPDESYLELMGVSGRTLTVNSQSAELLRNVNKASCRLYAPALSADKKELYYTVLDGAGTASPKFMVAVAKRTTLNEPFGKGAAITGINGDMVEGPSLSFDDGGKTLYYHKRDSTSGRFKIFKVNRP